MNYVLILISLFTFFSVAKADLIEKTVTLSFPAESPEQVEWQGLDLETANTWENPSLGSPIWQVRFRQGYVGTNTGAVVQISTKNFESIVRAPDQTAGYVVDRKYDPSGPAPLDLYNEKLMSWYDYFFMQGHLLAPKPYVFVLRTADHHYAKLQFKDYIKDGMAIRLVKVRDILGRVREKLQATEVQEKDGMVHVVVRYKYNTEPGSASLE